MAGRRYEGSNLEDALQKAAADLGVDTHRLDYHVVVEKRGFLGGIKRIVIQAEIAEIAEISERIETPAAATTASPELPTPAPGAAARPARSRRSRNDDGRRDRGSRTERSDRKTPRHREPVEIPPQGDESEGAGKVRGWCEELFSLAGLDLSVRTEENDEQIEVRLYGEDSERLTARDGELLDSLQVLANKSLSGISVTKQIEFDSSGFKEQRIERLEARARELADFVRAEGGEQLLPSMTPIERRIVHLALQDDADVTTESRGDGFYKRIAIIPRADA
ncbi:MAG: R3H domain-containing nucleic acid-binding protein [Thermoanaerobaculia bacterium]